MTDEEMAEEYKESRRLHGIPKERHLLVSQDERLNELKQAFLAGLKAGRPQWHDLRKDPNDLPKDKEYVLVYTNLTNYYVAEKVENHFMSKGWGFIPMSTVIAWCEIPTFDKE